MITIEQQPLKITPSDVEHVYTVSSSNSGNTEYRYVFDIYVDTTTPNPEKVARVLTSPNSYGKGIINIHKIIRNYVKGNARSEQPQYTSQSTTGTTPYSIITNVKGLSFSNGYNNNADYPNEYHVRDYRVMVGEQWYSGGTTQVFISSDASNPCSDFYVELGDSVAPYPGSPNTAYWYNAGANIVNGTGYDTGVYVEHLTFIGGLVYSAITSSFDGFYTPTFQPSDRDSLEVVERYSGIKYTYIYDLPTEAWIFVEIIYPISTQPLPFLSPCMVILWPGTNLHQGSYLPYNTQNQYWGASSPNQQQNYWEVLRYRMSGTTVNEAEPSLFLNTAGSSSYSVNQSAGFVSIYTDRARRRKHHPSCPILVSWFNGALSLTGDFYFDNSADGITFVETDDYNTPYTAVTETQIPQYTGLTPTDATILYYNQIRPDLAGGKVGYWTAMVGDTGEYNNYAFSEFLEFYIQENDCLSDPVHLLFLNKQGVWDTYTFDRKALSEKEIQRLFYSQGGVRNLNQFSLLSTDRRQVIYEQKIVERMKVSSWFLDDNDRPIVEDLFQSPEVYIIKDHDWTGKSPQTYNPYLLPVTLRTDTIQEYKNKYNKVFQYEFLMEYTPINQYKTQG